MDDSTISFNVFCAILNLFELTNRRINFVCCKMPSLKKIFYKGFLVLIGDCVNGKMCLLLNCVNNWVNWAVNLRLNGI